MNAGILTAGSSRIIHLSRLRRLEFDKNMSDAIHDSLLTRLRKIGTSLASNQGLRFTFRQMNRLSILPDYQSEFQVR